MAAPGVGRDARGSAGERPPPAEKAKGARRRHAGEATPWTRATRRLPRPGTLGRRRHGHEPCVASPGSTLGRLRRGHGPRAASPGPARWGGGATDTSRALPPPAAGRKEPGTTAFDQPPGLGSEAPPHPSAVPRAGKEGGRRREGERGGPRRAPKRARRPGGGERRREEDRIGGGRPARVQGARPGARKCQVAPGLCGELHETLPVLHVSLRRSTPDINAVNTGY